MKITIAQLKSEIDQVIIANGQQLIVGSILNGVLQDLVDSVQGVSIYYGSTAPTSLIGKSGDLYFRASNLVIYLNIGGTWFPIFSIIVDSTPTLNSNNPISSGGVYNSLTSKADLVNGKVPLSELPTGLTSSTRSYATIAARNADTDLTGVIFGFVVDATADPAVGSGSALYYNNNGTWVLFSDTNELSVVLTWTNVTGKPTFFNTQWGMISGTLTNQTDLVAALNTKMNTTLIDGSPVSGNTSHLISSDGVFQALVLKASAATLASHIANLSNPHQTTLEQARAQNNQIQGNIDANNNRILNLPSAVASSEPATFGQLSALIADSVKPPRPLDCSANPNYPAATAGDSYKVSVGGIIGGSSGLVVAVGDLIIASVNSSAGNQATVGANWGIYQTLVEQATNTVYGLIRLSTDAEAIAGSSNNNVLTPFTGSELYIQKAKTVFYQINPIGVNEVSFYMRNAGNINSITISGAHGVLLRTGLSSTYPSSVVYPYAYSIGDRVFASFIYDDLTKPICNLILNCIDN